MSRPCDNKTIAEILPCSGGRCGVWRGPHGKGECPHLQECREWWREHNLPSDDMGIEAVRNVVEIFKARVM